MNLTLELTTEQIIDLVQQMPPEEKILGRSCTYKGNSGTAQGAHEIC